MFDASAPCDQRSMATTEPQKRAPFATDLSENEPPLKKRLEASEYVKLPLTLTWG